MSMEKFDEVGQSIQGTKKSNMFGVVCYKIGRKPFIMLHEEQLVCKLYGEANDEALQLSGASHFNPMGGDKAMTNWVQIPMAHESLWEKYAIMAHTFVSNE